LQPNARANTEAQHSPQDQKEPVHVCAVQMSGSNALINLGELSKPATTLIEKISDAVGGIAKPWQIKRTAKAEAEADLIRTRTKIEVTELEYRALERLVNEEGKKQKNIEDITAKAIPLLSESARPENIESDWLTNFFDRSRLTSDAEMQSLWASILSNEANSPGTFSKRTINFLASLDKRDAQLFTNFCTFCWMFGDLSPLLFDIEKPTYIDKGLDFNTLTHLDSIGLVSFNNLAGFKKANIPKYFTVFYYGTPITIEFPADNNDLPIGMALLTNLGKELAPICGSKPSDDHFLDVLSEWHKLGLILSSSLRKRHNARCD
jgi:hypothetical protein